MIPKRIRTRIERPEVYWNLAAAAVSMLVLLTIVTIDAGRMPTEIW